MIFEQQTGAIDVRVRPLYSREHSDPKQGFYIWEYEIQVENKNLQTVQILSRYWRITNAVGEVEEVHGQGVVGLQPVIKSGEIFQYRSFTRLNTPDGNMTGTYTLRSENGEYFDIAIPTFVLQLPVRSIKTN